MKDFAIIMDIVNLTEVNGGGTFNHLGESINRKSGYQVSYSQGKGMNREKFLELVSLIYTSSKYYARIEASGDNIGTWLDEKTGLYYVELSHYFKSKKEALSKAKKYKQLAIYSWSSKKSLYLAA